MVVGGVCPTAAPGVVLPKQGDPHWPGIRRKARVVDVEVRGSIGRCYAEAMNFTGQPKHLYSIVASCCPRDLDEAEVYAAAGIPREAVASVHKVIGTGSIPLDVMRQEGCRSTVCTLYRRARASISKKLFVGLDQLAFAPHRHLLSSRPGSPTAPG